MLIQKSRDEIVNDVKELAKMKCSNAIPVHITGSRFPSFDWERFDEGQSESASRII